MFIRTMNPALGIALGKDKNWEATAGNLKIPPKDTNGRKIIERPAYSYKWVGFKSEYETDMIHLNTDYWKNISQRQMSLF